MNDLDYELTDFIAALMVYDRVAFFNSRFAVDCVTAMIRKYGHDEFTKVSSELYKHHLREYNARCWDADRFVPYESK